MSFTTITITNKYESRKQSKLLGDLYNDAKFRMKKYIREMHEFPRVGKMGIAMLAEITGLSKYNTRRFLDVLDLDWRKPGQNKTK